MNNYILDSSALIALIRKESGAEIVARYLKESIISSVNFSEVVAILARKIPKDIIVDLLSKLVSEIVLFDELQAIEAGMLYPQTKAYGLSLGDRACIALAINKGLPVLTADTSWSSLNLGINIINIRLTQ
ncbi:twitching motility protein PilT (plasmid) [Rickettsiales bacterium Ac37b]|nr:twitching motility protein PilT [Rickettsiales bacterium Ac37b]